MGDAFLGVPEGGKRLMSNGGEIIINYPTITSDGRQECSDISNQRYIDDIKNKRLAPS